MQILCKLKNGYAYKDGYEVAGLLTVRYVDNKYTFICVDLVPYLNFNDYLALTDYVLDSIDYESSGWTTAGTDVPDTEQAMAAYQQLAQTQSDAGTAKQNTKVSTKLINNNGTAKKKDTGFLAPFYWTDPDGDIWYWNGSYNVYYGKEGDFYTDEGDLYESNDAGWNSDLSYDFDYDYTPYSDPGDGDDAWSDPGDTQDYWSDPGDGDDAWSDPGDSYDYSDSYDSGDYGDYGDYSDPGDSYDYDDFGDW